MSRIDSAVADSDFGSAVCARSLIIFVVFHEFVWVLLFAQINSQLLISVWDVLMAMEEVVLAS